jgi:hypothetical protein
MTRTILLLVGILEISDPAKPRYVWHIPNETNRNSRSTSVVYDYKFDGSGRDYLIRNSEALTQGETGSDLKYQTFDITARDSDITLAPPPAGRARVRSTTRSTAKSARPSPERGRIQDSASPRRLRRTGIVCRSPA